jgi:hypothetical protein
MKCTVAEGGQTNEPARSPGALRFKKYSAQVSKKNPYADYSINALTIRKCQVGWRRLTLLGKVHRESAHGFAFTSPTSIWTQPRSGTAFRKVDSESRD